MSIWLEPIDRKPGRSPVVRATGTDVVYELSIAGGVMHDGLFSPPNKLRLQLRCDEHGDVRVRVTHAFWLSV